MNQLATDSLTDFNLQWGRWQLDLSVRPHIMGVINVTPDSFSDGGDFYNRDKAIAQGLSLAESGADILDIGGESARPGSEPISAEEELDRVIPVIEALASRVALPIAIDTYKSSVAGEALAAGASMLNDISAGRFDPDLLKLAASSGAPIILMHMKGQPRDMQLNPVYRDLMGEISLFLKDAVERAEKAGVSRKMIIVDPGIGFGKTYDHNLILLNRLEELLALGQPLLVGPSRKAFIGAILNGAPPKARDAGTAAAAALAAYKGAHILRVHSTGLVRDMLAVVQAIRREKV